LLDTNFLLIPAQFGVDIFQEIDRIISHKYNLFVLEENLKELRSLAVQSEKQKREVKIALALSQKCKIFTPDSSYSQISNVDDLIFQVALNYNMIVATNDKKLRRKLHSYQIPTITLRKKAYLILEGEIIPNKSVLQSMDNLNYRKIKDKNI